MAEFPSLPLFTDAYIADTQHLTNEEHGVYLRLLMFAWRSPDCALPEDDRRLAIMVGVTAKKWASLKVAVMAFWTLTDAGWQQSRLVHERERVAAIVAQRSEAGTASATARKRCLATKSLPAGSNPINDVANPAEQDRSDKPLINNDAGQTDVATGTPTAAQHPEPYPYKSGGGGSAGAREASDGDDDPSPPDEDIPTFRERLLVACGVSPKNGLTGPNGRMIGTTADMHTARRWTRPRSEDGLDLTEDEAVQIATQTMCRKRDGPPSGFGYFDAPMARASAAKFAPAPIARQAGSPRDGPPPTSSTSPAALRQMEDAIEADEARRRRK